MFFFFYCALVNTYMLSIEIIKFWFDFDIFQNSISQCSSICFLQLVMIAIISKYHLAYLIAPPPIQLSPYLTRPNLAQPNLTRPCPTMSDHTSPDLTQPWACHALPLYALRAANPETAIRLFQVLLPARWAACGCFLHSWTPHTIRLCSCHPFIDFVV